MSFIFEIDGATVWSPALRVGQTYEGFVRVLEGALEQPSGFSHNAADHIKIDADRFSEFIRRLLDEAAGGHAVMAEQMYSVLGPSVVMMERAGRSIEADSPIDEKLLARARQMAGVMPA